MGGFIIANIVVIGYLVALFGFLLGCVFSIVTSQYGKIFHACIMGFTGGLLLAFVCFEILPVAFITWGLYHGVFGILLGVMASVFIESKISSSKILLSEKYNAKFLKTALLLAFSVSLHNIPEGMALGSLLSYNYKAGLAMAIIISIHCFPESLAICLPLRKSGASFKLLFLYALALSLPMAIGSFIGAYLGNISGLFVSLCLSFASGVMLYVTCGEIIPESKNIWGGKITTVFSCIGFVFGIVVLNKI